MAQNKMLGFTNSKKLRKPPRPLQGVTKDGWGLRGATSTSSSRCLLHVCCLAVIRCLLLLAFSDHLLLAHCLLSSDRPLLAIVFVVRGHPLLSSGHPLFAASYL